jgi:hypothetical protein
VQPIARVPRPSRPKRPQRVPRALSLAVIGVLTATAAACSGGDDASTATTTDSTDTAAATTVAVSTSTSSSSTTTSTTEAPTTTEAVTTTTEPPVPVYPLTGVVMTDPFIAALPALVVKIDNAPGARPQSGMNEADIVVEEIVNDNLTRFAFVFQSHGAEPVGPIRSGRIQDIDLFGAFNHPLFAWSGGNRTVTDAIRASDLVDIGPSRAAVYFRSSDRKAPHNLYSNTGALWSQAPTGSQPPQQQFAYRGADEAVQGAPSAGVALVLDSIDVRWDWDAAAGLYRRTMENRVHDDALSGPVTTNNVVVLEMSYLPGISDSPDAQTIGSGRAFVFTGGNMVEATWTRADRLVPFTLTATDGTPVELTPGRTFIELPRADHTIPLPAG